MGHVDLADQLRGTYRPDIWVRNRKWWWAIWFWALGVLLTNAYIVYLKVNEKEGIPKSQLLSQHDFREMIAISWINPKYYEMYLKHKRFGGAKKIIVSPVDCNGNAYNRGEYSEDTATVSSLSFSGDSSFSSSNKPSPSTPVTDNTLEPLTGKLACRLVHDRDHFPLLKRGNEVKCQLHRWGNGSFVQKDVIRCPTCNVHLCTECYRLFHLERYLVDKRETLFP